MGEAMPKNKANFKKMRDLKLKRNIGIAAHIDAGKTTLSERMLHISGKIHQIGEVHHGNAVMDHGREEQQRGITITAAATQFEWASNHQLYTLNLIDTPGHVDFTVEVERSMRVLDGVVAVFSAVSGVEPQSETVWRQADRYQVPRIAFVNKMDLAGADFQKVVKQIRERLGSHALALQLPIGEAETYQGHIDLLEMKAYAWRDAESMEFHEIAIPEDLLASAQAMRASLIEAIVETDEALLEQYLDQPGDLRLVDLKAALRAACIRRELVPVLAGSAFRNKGVQALLDAICDYLPSAVDRKLIEGFHPDDSGISLRRETTKEEDFAALAFKIAVDEQNRQMIFLRVYSGSLKRGDSVINVRTGKRERLGSMYQLHGGKRQSIDRLEAGDIAAVMGLKNIRTGDTLSALDAPIVLEDMQFPEPVVGLAIEPGSNKDRVKLAKALSILMQEDPGFQVKQDEETGQTIIRGMGELHLEIALSRLQNDFAIECKLGQPEVSYKEIFTQTTRHTERLVKQDGGSGLFAVIDFEIGPADESFLASDQGSLQFVDEVRGGAIPKEMIASVESGFRKMLSEGVLAGYKMDSMKVRLIDGQTHEKDSKPLAFEMVAQRGFRAAAMAAKPILLEPIMHLEVRVAEEYLGNVLSGISKRRGLVLGTETEHTAMKVAAHVPLAELFGYVNSLRSATAGRATASMRLAEFAPAPQALLQSMA